MTQDEPLVSSIPYPKEEKSLPMVLSRKDLIRLFDAGCLVAVCEYEAGGAAQASQE